MKEGAFQRSLLIAALIGCAGTHTQAAEPARKLWAHSVSLGLTLTRGNSETVLGVANWLSTKKTDKQEIRLGADAAYGETDGARSAQTLRGFGQYNRMFSERFYAYGRAEGHHDGIADIDYRFVLSPGAGYYFIKSGRTQLSGEVGPGWVFERKGDREYDYFTLRAAERFEQKLGEKARLWQTVEFLPQVEDWDNFTIKAEIGIETPITANVNLRAYLQDTYHSQPASGRKRNDMKLVTAVAYSF